MSEFGSSSRLRQLVRVRDLLALLDPSSFASRADEYMRGGLPASSLRDGSRSSTLPLPELDSTDAFILAILRDQARGYNELETVAFGLWKREQSLLVKYEPKPTDFAVPCSNTQCVPTPEHQDWGFLSESDIDHGFRECAKCRKHRERHGTPWPEKNVLGLQQSA